MSIICSDTGKPYVAPEVFELELEESIEAAEDAVWLASYDLAVRRNVAQQLRERKELMS